MRDRTDWVRDTSDEPIKVGKKAYKNLVRFSRACATCAQPFSIHVTQKIADGLADSNNFGLRNCEKHRRSGSGDNPETIMVNNVMKAELDGCYATIRELQARLALYELPAAMSSLQYGEGAASQRVKMPWE